MTGRLATAAAMATFGATGCRAGLVPNESGEAVSVIDFGPVGRGDDATALDRALSTGKAVSIPAGLTLVIDSDVILRPGQLLFGEGPGARIRLKSNFSANNIKVLLSNGSNIRDLHFEELDVVDRTGLYGTIFGKNVSRCLIQRVEISGSSSTGMMFLNSKDIIVEACHVHDTMADGIHAQRGSQRIAIRDCRIERTGDDGVAFVSHGYDYYGAVAQCSVRDTIIADVRRTGSGVAVIGAYNINVANCQIKDTPMSGIRVASADFGAEGSVIAQHVMVTNNSIIGTGSGPLTNNNGGVFAEGCCDVTIRANIITSPRSWGIATSNIVQDVKILDNVITDPGDVGMFISTAPGSQRYQRMWSASKRTRSRNLMVKGNRIMRPVGTGIYLAAEKGYPPDTLIVRDNVVEGPAANQGNRAMRAVFSDNNVGAVILQNNFEHLTR